MMQYRQREFPGTERKRRRRKTAPQKIEKLSAEMLNNIKGVQANPTMDLMSNWEEIVGTELSDHIKLQKLDLEGTLFLLAEDSNWATKARWQSAKIQKNASRFLEMGQLKTIKIQTSIKGFKKS